MEVGGTGGKAHKNEWHFTATSPLQAIHLPDDLVRFLSCPKFKKEVFSHNQL